LSECGTTSTTPLSLSVPSWKKRQSPPSHAHGHISSQTVTRFLFTVGERTTSTATTSAESQGWYSTPCWITLFSTARSRMALLMVVWNNPLPIGQAQGVELGKPWSRLRGRREKVYPVARPLRGHSSETLGLLTLSYIVYPRTPSDYKIITLSTPRVLEFPVWLFGVVNRWCN